MSDISFNCTLNEKMLQDSFRSTLEECFGMLASVYSLKVVYYSVLLGYAIIRCTREIYKLVWTCITLTNCIISFPVSCNVIHCGSTLRCCQNELIRLFEIEKLVSNNIKVIENEKKELLGILDEIL
ncbi:ribonuclease P/MRP protein subunit POP5, putative [Cryptosporidium muris RN66]|uniref:Ribonuclease P/MRP protein subunit POP5, putative n=1 Tax=Cryptosporidium muris (strain RN66) TaxID=441375 RepID=B6AGE3_CRYMR|nr:ribonuclease P/MRP protein subunit POP5, putative [Cryptosporidium muris RN66]EEA07284.1 ribonuclease P/MRP protein subunit POP5, putative [Cryptosporidium muris RN66]|eukprot:XP_002141633.1 ribonuclease P/MRP protein subunit POP5 [Cryptosporidium muris RN66]